MTFRFATAAAALGALSLISTPAAASCGAGVYCTSGASHAGHGAHTVSGDYGYGYSSGYGYGNTYAGVASADYASSVYGSGSISETYSAGNTQVVSFPVQSTSTGYAPMSNWTVPGLGANERLTPTSCPTAVHNPEGGQVLGCYSVVKPAPVYRRLQVVRPVVYVPVPVPTPVYSNCTRTVVTHSSRYGDDYGYGHGYGHSHGAHHQGYHGGCRR